MKFAPTSAVDVGASHYTKQLDAQGIIYISVWISRAASVSTPTGQGKAGTSLRMCISAVARGESDNGLTKQKAVLLDGLLFLRRGVERQVLRLAYRVKSAHSQDMSLVPPLHAPLKPP
jgi:hypothetical protein